MCEHGERAARDLRVPFVMAWPLRCHEWPTDWVHRLCSSRLLTAKKHELVSSQNKAPSSQIAGDVGPTSATLRDFSNSAYCPGRPKHTDKSYVDAHAL